MGHLLLAGGPGGWRPVDFRTYLLKQRQTVRMMGSTRGDQELKKAAGDFFVTTVASPSGSPPLQPILPHGGSGVDTL